MVSAGDRVVETLTAVTAALPGGGEDRTGQADMARAVAEAIDEEQHLVVEAGTGTGKSLAYLVAAVHVKRRTVIATATKALQDQLANKDLPFLAEQVERDGQMGFEWAVLKGRSNYLCRQRLSELSDTGQQLGLDVGEDDAVDDDALADIASWAERTRTGDRAELWFEPSGRTWSAVSVGPTECPGAQKCPMGSTCFAEMAREVALEADITVVNTHLYALDLLTDNAILGEHEVVVIDEAHQLEDIVASAAGFELTSGRFRNLANTIRSIIADDQLPTDLIDIGMALGDDLEPHGGNRLGAAELGADLGKTLDRARDRANRAMDALRKIPKESSSEVIGRKERAMRAATHVVLDIDMVLDLADGTVAWVDGGSNPSLKAASIDVDKLLREKLWDARTAILTSATVPARMAERLGLEAGEHRVLDVGSPFDFETAGLLYCPVTMPDPRDDAYRDALHNEIEALVMAAGGRTMCLFTSFRSMNLARDHLIDRLPMTLLVQGEAPKPALVDAFTGDEESVLLATMSFWQGVDIPGRSLSCVIIDRLPFPRPDDPLLDARRNRVGRSAFGEIDVPRAAMLLAQGAGRLVRRADDRGVVAVLDKRLATAKSYRWDLINALPPLRRSKDRDEVLAFLRSIRDDVEMGQV